MDPRSGCRKINNIGIKNTPETLANTKSESLTVPILDLAKMLATIIKVPILAPSVGWTRVRPRSTQRLAPMSS